VYPTKFRPVGYFARSRRIPQETLSWDTVSAFEPAHGVRRACVSSESRMRKICMSGSMSGKKSYRAESGLSDRSRRGVELSAHADSAYKQPLCQRPIEAERVTGAANGPVKLGHVGRAGALSGRCGARIFAFSPEMLAYCVSSQDPPGAARWLGGGEVHRRGQSDRSSWGGARLECAGPTDSPSPPR
jgi:hypothetical protein